MLSSLNVSGFTTLNNNTSINGILNVSGNSTFNGDVNIGTGTSNLTASLINLRNSHFDTGQYGANIVSYYNGVNGHNLQFQTRNTPTGIFQNNLIMSAAGHVSIIKDLKVDGNLAVGTAIINNKFEVSGETGMRISDYRDIGIASLEFVTNKTTDRTFGSSSSTDWKIHTSLDGRLNFSNRTSYPNNLIESVSVSLSNKGDFACVSLTVTGKIEGYITSRAPIYFTTSRNATVNGINYSAYDVDLNMYTKFITLDGRKIRQFRLRSWHASGDFENYSAEIALNYHIFMSDLNGLSVKAFSAPYINYELNQLNGSTPSFYRNSFDTITYLAPVNYYGSNIKVYCIFEDLL
jgi:hypothetical protein